VIATSFTKLLGVTAPIQLAAMPGISTPDLIAALADAGALGMLGLMSAAVLERVLEQLSGRTKGVFGANFLIPFLDLACVSVAARRARDATSSWFREPRRGAMFVERRACFRCCPGF
jgi:NAD(P)H-dependent flavin oxidoreductase YrpB (nitropropane dioxygenase family)